MDIVFFGDSLTFGYGLDNKSKFVNIIKSNTNFHVINKGINGDTSTGLLSRITKDVISLKPDYCSLMIGTNDFLSNRNINFVFDNISLIIKELLENSIKPIICIPPCTNEELALQFWSSEVNYKKVNTNLLLLKNLLLAHYTDFIVNDFYSISKDINLFIDGIHLNAKGNLLIANLWLENLKANLS